MTELGLKHRQPGGRAHSLPRCPVLAQSEGTLEQGSPVIWQEYHQLEWGAG